MGIKQFFVSWVPHWMSPKAAGSGFSAAGCDLYLITVSYVLFINISNAVNKNAHIYHKN